MSLDVYLHIKSSNPKIEDAEVYWANITHNLTLMADKAGIYQHLWRPEELGFTKGGQLIEGLQAGLFKLKENPDFFRTFDAPNGWGTYDGFVSFVEKYLDACQAFPTAEIYISR